MTPQESAAVIYWQDGSCVGVRCGECPFYQKKVCLNSGDLPSSDKAVKRAAKKLMKRKTQQESNNGLL